MSWSLDFITKEDFKNHVKQTIDLYVDKIDSKTLTDFNKNTVDPIKFLFDKKVYDLSWEQLIENELMRQRDKSRSNDIGYFHQNIFKYIQSCEVPNHGWDVIVTEEDNKEIAINESLNVKRIYVELKNKHNTMNSSASAKTYMKMQNQLLNDDECACFLVEVIAKKSQNVKWTSSLDGNKVSHNRIRRVSIDVFYDLVTGVEDSFYKICLVLPDVIDEVLKESPELQLQEDTVLEELTQYEKSKGISREVAFYLLGFNGYIGFPE